MGINSKIKFGNLKIKEAYTDLDSDKFQDNKLKQWLDNALGELEKNAFSGIQIQKRLIPKEYIRKFGKLDNLWKYDLPEGWRLIYTIRKEEVIVVTIILEWLDHKTYEKRFRY